LQTFCFYPFSWLSRFSGIAAFLLFPFFLAQATFGHCRPSVFTLFLGSADFWAVQNFCFYPFSWFSRFSGLAALLLLPFFLAQAIFGH
jgi:hypothetical protein